MSICSIYVTPVSDCLPATLTPVLDCCPATLRRENIVRLAIVRAFKDGESTASGRPFKSFADLIKELVRTDLLDGGDLSDLQQNVSNGLSWQSPNAVVITDEQVRQLKLQPV